MGSGQVAFCSLALVFDVVHLLHDTRGPVLEALFTLPRRHTGSRTACSVGWVEWDAPTLRWRRYRHRDEAQAARLRVAAEYSASGRVPDRCAARRQPQCGALSWGVRTVGEGAVLLAETYIYLCMLFSPRLYGVGEEETTADPTLDARSLDQINTAAKCLHDPGLAVHDRYTGAIAPTDPGRVTSYYYMMRATVAKATAGLAQTTDENDLLRLFSNAAE